MLTKSENANDNYCAQVVVVERISKHQNADKLQIVTINGNPVIVDMNTKIGDICIYFPLESAIAGSYLAANSVFREKDLNADKSKSGFFEAHGRCRAVRLRSSSSEGYLVPVETLLGFAGLTEADVTWIKSQVGVEFDTVNGEQICRKYVPKGTKPVSDRVKDGNRGKTPRFNKLIDGQFYLHFDTTQLGRAVHELDPNDLISVSAKLHGTSYVVGNVLNKRQLTWRDKVAKFIGVPVREEEYGILYSSRRVIKNANINPYAVHFYSEDIWGTVAKELAPVLRKGETVYGEIVGFIGDASYIQRGFDYGLSTSEHRAYIYRITQTNADGQSFDLAWHQVKERCNAMGVPYCPEYYYGKAKDMYPDIDTKHFWHQNFLERLQADYLEKRCVICKNDVPDEGIVIRRESMALKNYKLKSFAFKMYESKQLDEGVVDLETQESEAGEAVDAI